MEIPKILESKMKVRFHDCDPFNHLNNSRYIDYIMTARGDQLQDSYGFDIYQLLQQQGICWVFAQTQISYLSPAYLMEMITIQTQLLAYTSKSLLLEARVWNDDKTVLKAIMWAKFVHFNLATKKTEEHSAQLMEFFQGIVYPLEQQPDFESRVKALMHKK